ncbi:hypothetical protein LA080_015842 [Diaporthe eres]|uniref:LITAF domain-containing protein n=1 Tax=Diaporthe vaccinii TaxID=105482 RepID=A0ABR4EW74_9PEZI|nr:hypothetical protein LA080_015842 [Diaporthe eres]
MDNTKPEAQQQPLPETEITSDSSASPPQQQPDISPGIYPAPLQPSASPEPRSRSRTGSSPPRRPEAETLPAHSSRHERMPSVNSLPPKEGQFGLVSSSGQLVCEFRPTPSGEGVPRPQQAPEEQITRATFAAYSEHNPPAILSLSPPPEAAPFSPPAGPTVSSLELVVDYNNYPEVYIPEADQPQQQEGEQRPDLPPRTTTTSPPIPRKSLPMEYSTSSVESPPPPAPAYSTPADYQRIGYTGTLDMSTAVATVTPLHMLEDQPDTVDCPFCMRRVETSVKKKASSRTHTWGAILFFSTLLGVVAPYCCDWYVNVEHYCKNCRRKVAQKKFDSTETEALGTRPEHRQVSYFQPAEKPEKKKLFRS